MLLNAVVAFTLAVVPPAEAVRPESVMGALRSIPTERSVVGGDADRLGLARTEGFIEGWLRALGHDVHEQEITWPLPDRDAAGPVTGRNLWVDLRGETKPTEVLILGAHFDAVPGTPGADDNATGVAAALEVVRVLSGRRHERTVRVMFFTAEEIGLVGSRTYARDIARPALASGDETIVGMVSLEMLGYFSDEPDSQSSPIGAIPGVFEPPTVGDFIAIVGVAPHAEFIRAFAGGMKRASPEPKVFDTSFLPFAPPDLHRSDHAPFWRLGVPAVMLTDTSNFRNPHYHRPTDTVETLDEDRFVQVVRGVATATHEIAGPIDDE